MARNRKRKTNIELSSEESMREAVQLVLQNGLSLRKAAELKNVPFQTLAR